MSYVADGVRYLSQELHSLLEVVVPGFDQSVALLKSDQRQGEITALLDLLDELAPTAAAGVQGQIQMLSKQIRLALPHTLLFARRLDAIQEQACQQLRPEAVALLAWAWLRRAILGPTPKDLLQGVAPAWRAAAHDRSRMLGHTLSVPAVPSKTGTAWSGPIWRFTASCRRASSLCWRSGAITKLLLAVAHEGLSPLQRTGSTPSDSTWLAALGYSCVAA